MTTNDNSLELKSPQEWLDWLDTQPDGTPWKGVSIMDHDGWRGENAPAFDAPITWDEFNSRIAICTVMPRR